MNKEQIKVIKEIFEDILYDENNNLSEKTIIKIRKIYEVLIKEI